MVAFFPLQLLRAAAATVLVNQSPSGRFCELVNQSNRIEFKRLKGAFPAWQIFRATASFCDLFPAAAADGETFFDVRRSTKLRAIDPLDRCRHGRPRPKSQSVVVHYRCLMHAAHTVPE